MAAAEGDSTHGQGDCAPAGVCKAGTAAARVCALPTAGGCMVSWAVESRAMHVLCGADALALLGPAAAAVAGGAGIAAAAPASTVLDTAGAATMAAFAPAAAAAWRAASHAAAATALARCASSGSSGSRVRKKRRRAGGGATCAGQARQYAGGLHHRRVQCTREVGACTVRC